MSLPQHRPQQSRSQETSIRLDAPIAEVWRLLTTGDGLKQWFGLDARDATAGGKFYVAWGEGVAIDSPVTIFEPGKHLRIASPMERDGRVMEFATDFYLGTADGQTVLRIVSSGFGTGESWDGEFDGMLQGWAIFAQNIAHYCTRFAGKTGRSFGFPLVAGLKREEAFARFIGPRGLGLGDPASLALDGDVTAQTGWGDTFAARLDVWSPPCACGLVLTAHNDALVRGEFNGAGAETYFNLMVLTWDLPAERVAALEQSFRRGLEALYADVPVASPAGHSCG